MLLDDIRMSGVGTVEPSVSEHLQIPQRQIPTTLTGKKERKGGAHAKLSIPNLRTVLVPFLAKNSSNYLCLICGDRVTLVLVTDPAHSNKVTLHLNFTDVRTS